MFSCRCEVVLTARHQIESVGIHCETGDSVKMSHHWVNQLAWEEHQRKNSIYHNNNNNLVSKAVSVTCVIVEEPDVPILLCRDGDGQRRVTQDFIDLTRRIWRSNIPERIMGLSQSLIMQNHLLLRFMWQFYIFSVSYQKQELIDTSVYKSIRLINAVEVLFFVS